MVAAQEIWRPREADEHGLPLYPPGVVVAPGEYAPLDRPAAASIVLERPDVLPALLDGHQVRYLRVRAFDGRRD